MNQFRIESKNRRRVTRTLTVVAIGVAAAVSLNAGNVLAQAPKAPVTINVVDVAGNLALTQDAMRDLSRRRIRTSSPRSTSRRRRRRSFPAS